MLLAELADVLPRAKFAKRLTAADMSVARIANRYARLSTLIIAAEITPAVPGDPDDDHVLACALAAQADLIISGDKRLRGLKTYQSIRILSPAAALSADAGEVLRGDGERRDLSVEPLTQVALCDLEVVLCLQVHPELRLHAEEPPEP